MNRLTAIVSGGQTGADRGGLDAAIALDLGYGGWAPKGWRAEDGAIPEIYRAHMRESVREDYGLRTRLNVQDSDGTLIVTFASTLTGGSEYTANQARAQKRPCKHLVLTAGGHTRINDAVRTALLEWVDANRISVLNVAGPRESKEPGIHRAVRDALVWVFEDDSAALPAGMTMEPWQPVHPTVRQEEERPTGAAAQPAVDPGSTPGGSDRCDLCDALASDASPSAAEQARTGFYPPNCPSRCPTCGAPPWFERAENKQPPRDPAPGDFVVPREDFVRKVRFE